MSELQQRASHHLFGSSGIRRIVDADTIRLMLETGFVVGGKYRTAIVGCDHRTSNEALKYAFIAGLLSAGCEAYDAGIVPTPTVAYEARKFGVGVMITASHNPPEYNGVKLINPDGSSFAKEQRTRIEADMVEKSYSTTSWEHIKKRVEYSVAIDNHIARILKDFAGGYELRVVVDCCCGAASTVTPRLLRELGCEVFCINCVHDGTFRFLEPNVHNLKQLSEAVISQKADLGIANDGDGDRMVVVDDTGRVLSGDEVMAIFSVQMGVKKLVTPVDTSMLVDDLGLEVVRTRVGDTYVSEELIKDGDFGGEQSGCWIFPPISYCPDGIYASAKFIEITAEYRLSEMLESIPRYPVLRGSVTSNGVNIKKLKDLLQGIEASEISTIDGMRLTFPDAWLLVRLSGTEPIIRIAAEARSEDRVKEIYNIAVEQIESSRES